MWMCSCNCYSFFSTSCAALWSAIVCYICLVLISIPNSFQIQCIRLVPSNNTRQEWEWARGKPILFITCYCWMYALVCDCTSSARSCGIELALARPVQVWYGEIGIDTNTTQNYILSAAIQPFGSSHCARRGIDSVSTATATNDK